MSSTLTSFRFRLLSSWNGSSFAVSLSMATASASNTNVFVPSLTHCRACGQPRHSADEPIDMRMGKARCQHVRAGAVP